jgi:hypothetical protein
MNSRYLFHTLAVLLCSLIIGCAGFPDKELKYSYDQIVPRDPKPSIDYDRSFYMGDYRGGDGVRDKMFNEEVEKVFSKSMLFSKVSPGIGNEPVHLSLVMFFTGSTNEFSVYILNALLTSITLGVIPFHGTLNFELRVDVKKGNQLLKQYRYNNTISTWCQLFLVVLTPTHFPLNVERAIMDDMLLNFLYDIQQDNLLY